MEIYEYDTQRYNWRQCIEDLLNSDLESIHEKYTFESEEKWVGDKSPKSSATFPEGHVVEIGSKTTKSQFSEIVDRVYKYFREDVSFNRLWDEWSNDVMKSILNSDVIAIQRLPSFKIVPSNSKITYSDEDPTMQDGVEYNLHSDGALANHPIWERNFWMPITDVDEDNCLWVQSKEDSKLYPMLLKYGQILGFEGNYMLHGTKCHNKSKNTRISFDFRGCSYEDYDVSILTDKPTKIAGVIYEQKEIYTVDKYYRKI